MCSFDWYAVNALHFESTTSFSSTGIATGWGFGTVLFVSLLLTAILFALAWRWTRKLKRWVQVTVRILAGIGSLIAFVILFIAITFFFGPSLFNICSSPPMPEVTAQSLLADVNAEPTFIRQAIFADGYKVRLPKREHPLECKSDVCNPWPNTERPFVCANDACKDIMRIQIEGRELVSPQERTYGFIFTCLGNNAIWISISDESWWHWNRDAYSQVIPDRCINYAELRSYPNIGKVALPRKYADPKHCDAVNWSHPLSTGSASDCIVSVALTHQDPNICETLSYPDICKRRVRDILSAPRIDPDEVDTEQWLIVRTGKIIENVSLVQHIYLLRECRGCDERALWRNETRPYEEFTILGSTDGYSGFMVNRVVATAITDRDGIALFKRNILENATYRAGDAEFIYSGQERIE